MGLPALAASPVLGPLSLGLTAAGAGISAIGAAQSASAQAANARYQAQVARNNQIVAEQNAGAAIQTGEERVTARSLAGAAALGRIKVGQAANNVDINVGSPVAVRASQAQMNQLDTATVMNTAELESYGYRAQGANYLAQSQLDTAEAAQARAAAPIAVSASLIGGAGQVADRYLWMAQNAGRPGGGGGALGAPFGTGGLY
jgi:hypothetical protein